MAAKAKKPGLMERLKAREFRKVTPQNQLAVMRLPKDQLAVVKELAEAWERGDFEGIQKTEIVAGLAAEGIEITYDAFRGYLDARKEGRC